jgi:hypothetical protein
MEPIERVVSEGDWVPAAEDNASADEEEPAAEVVGAMAI